MKIKHLAPANQFDWFLFSLIVILSAIGVINLYSATRAAPLGLFSQQLFWYVLAFVSFFLIVFLFNLRYLQNYAVPIFIVCLTLLVLALLLVKSGGDTINSSHQTARWLKISDITIQPSEFMKIGLIVICAKLFSMESSEYEFSPWRFIILWHIIIGVSALLVIKQPDLGTGCLCVLIGITMLITSRIRLLLKLFVLTVDLLLGVGFFLIFGLKKYQQDRLEVFFQHDKYILTKGFQITQAISAIGSGGLFGKGFLHGTQNQLHFLPVQWTDFVFAVFAEEWGFIGCLIVLLLFWTLILWLLNISRDVKDRFSKNLLIGSTSLIFWHTVINIAMVCRLIPVVGINLPFFSHGGSNLLTSFIALAICMNISMRRSSQGL